MKLLYVRRICTSLTWGQENVEFELLLLLRETKDILPKIQYTPLLQQYIISVDKS